jgi:hypothetical protein
VAMTNAAYYLVFTYVVERRKALTGEGGEAFCSPTRSACWGPAREAVRRLALRSHGTPTVDDGASPWPCWRSSTGCADDALRAARTRSLGVQHPHGVPVGMALGCRARWWSRSFRCARG